MQFTEIFDQFMDANNALEPGGSLAYYTAKAQGAAGATARTGNEAFGKLMGKSLRNEEQIFNEVEANYLFEKQLRHQQFAENAEAYETREKLEERRSNLKAQIIKVGSIFINTPVIMKYNGEEYKILITNNELYVEKLSD